MTATDAYRGPRIIARGGRGRGSWIWVVPGTQNASPEELAQRTDSGIDTSTIIDVTSG